MAKKAQSFAEKTAKHGGEKKRMANLILTEKKENGHFSFRTKMVPMYEVKSAIAQSKS